MTDNPLHSAPLFMLGPVPIGGAVLTTWGLMLVLVLGSALATRRLKLVPGPGQAALELLVTGIAGQLRETLRQDPAPFLPLLGTLFLFLASANLLALLPGLRPPTAQLEAPAALATVVFCAVHWFGVQRLGWRRYLAGFLQPVWVMLPLNLVAEFTRAFSLMVRLFGNIMSGVFIGGLVLGLAGLLVPIPFMALDLLTGLVQAYIFTVLATVFIGAAIGATDKA